MPIHFEITRNQALLKEYYQIREFCFRNDLGLFGFDGSEDEFDRSGQVMVALSNGQCIGGARISGRVGAQGVPLPLEQEGLNLSHILSSVDGDGAGYCQWTRMALLPGHRDPSTLRLMCQAMIDVAIQQGYEFAFNVSGMTRARLYKRLHSTLGYNYRILDDIPVPEAKGFSGLPHLLSVACLGQGFAVSETASSAA